MLNIPLPPRPKPVKRVTIPNDPLTDKEKNELKLYEERKRKYKLGLFILFFMMEYLLICLLCTPEKSKIICSFQGIHIYSFYPLLLLLMLLSFPISMFVPIILENITINKSRFFNPSKTLQKKAEQQQLRENQMEAVSKDAQRHFHEMRTYLQQMESLKDEYPGLEECNFDMTLYTQMVSKSLSTELKSIFNRSYSLIKNESEMDDWISCSDREFEMKTARWYELCGYEVELTPKSNDGGIDVIARKGTEKIYIQCKQYKNSRVPVSVARELFGVMAADHVQQGAIVCVMGGDKGTIEFAEKNHIDIVTVEDICEDIASRVRVMYSYNYPSTIVDKGDYYLYQGYGTFEIFKETFSDIHTLCHQLKSTYIWDNEYHVAVIQWKRYIYIVLRYKKEQKKFLSERLIEFRLDNNFNYHHETIKQLNPTSTRHTKKTKKRRYYNRWY